MDGKTELDNLAYACYQCNRFKGPNIATHDPQTGLLTRLFHPRADHWSDHFRLNGPVIEPLTSAGWGTVTLLRFNQERRIALRAELLLQGVYSPLDKPQESPDMQNQGGMRDLHIPPR